MLHVPVFRCHRRITTVAKSTIVAFLLNALIQPVTMAQDGTLQLADGLAAGTNTLKKLSVQANYRAQSNQTQIALRVLLPRLLDNLVLFADASITRGQLDDLAVNGDIDVSGTGEGIGLYYVGLPDWRQFTPLVRLSLRREDLEDDSILAVASQQANLDQKLRSTSLALLISPSSPSFRNGGSYYVGLGFSYNRVRESLRVDNIVEPRLSDADDVLRPYLAAGISVPWRRLQWFAAIDAEETLGLTMGFRLLAK